MPFWANTRTPFAQERGREETGISSKHYLSATVRVKHPSTRGALQPARGKGRIPPPSSNEIFAHSLSFTSATLSFSLLVDARGGRGSNRLPAHGIRDPTSWQESNISPPLSLFFFSFSFFFVPSWTRRTIAPQFLQNSRPGYFFPNSQAGYVWVQALITTLNHIDEPLRLSQPLPPEPLILDRPLHSRSWAVKSRYWSQFWIEPIPVNLK